MLNHVDTMMLIYIYMNVGVCVPVCVYVLVSVRERERECVCVCVCVCCTVQIRLPWVSGHFSAGVSVHVCVKNPVQTHAAIGADAFSRRGGQHYFLLCRHYLLCRQYLLQLSAVAVQTCLHKYIYIVTLS